MLKKKEGEKKSYFIVHLYLNDPREVLEITVP